MSVFSTKMSLSFGWLLVLLFIMAGSSSLRGSELEKIQTLLSKYKVSLDKKDLVMIDEVFGFWDRFGKEIWPDVEIRKIPLMFVFPQRQNILLGHPAPPPNALPLSESFPILGKKAVMFTNNAINYGTFCQPDFLGVPTICINALDDFNAHVRNSGKELGIPGVATYSKPLLLHLGTILHELFHAFQYAEMKYFTPSPGFTPPRLTKIDYPYQDEEVDLLLGLEGLILKDAVKTSDLASRGKLLQDFGLVRAERRKKLHPDLVKLENNLEITEGTAQYLQYMLEFPAPEKLASFKELKELAEFQTAKPGDPKVPIIENLEQLYSPDLAMSMQYVYHSGVAQAFLLDSLIPSWKASFFRIHSSFDELIVPPSVASTQERLQVIEARYGVPELREKIRANLSGIKAKMETAFNKYCSEKGIKIRIQGKGVPPEGICLVGPAKLVEYNDYRIYELGVTMIRFQKLTERWLVDMAFKIPRPVIFQRKSGEVSFIFDGDLRLDTAVKADKSVATGMEKITYVGSVTVDTPVFSLSCKELEVTQTKGEILFNMIQ